MVVLLSFLPAVMDAHSFLPAAPSLTSTFSIKHGFQIGLVVAWYAGNTLYNVYNKKATNMIHAHWFVACAQLFVGMLWSIVMWVTGMRKKPNLTAADIAACVPIGLMACLSHAGSVLAVSYDNLN
jgi:hypothetical protein